jgi:quercetin dioxygenase-like cupin family protein
MSDTLIQKPWGTEQIWANTAHYIGKILTIKKACSLSYQFHQIKEETIYVMEGEIELEFEKDNKKQSIQLNVGDSFHIPPKMKHRMIAVQNCKVIEVSTPHLDDVVRLEDEYGRV